MNGPDRYALHRVQSAVLLALPVTGDMAAGDPVRKLFASLIAGQMTGMGCLPADLGIGQAAFDTLCARYFAGTPLPMRRQQPEAIPEWEDLQQLLLRARAGQGEHEHWLASMVATACAGRDHLWQDLGLANRDELSALMMLAFPALASANSADMKWKKFLYKQFCAEEGIYVCPAPSCSACADQPKCFGPET